MADLPLPIHSVATPASGLRLSHPWLGFLLFLIPVATAAGLGALFAPDAWYASLEKPSWNPPNAVFAPVWTVLYALMAIAAWMVWRAPGPLADRRRGLKRWGLQLALNAAWSPLFFGAHAPGLALVDILLLLVAIGFTISAFARVRRSAAALMLPYLAWVAFAACLNAAIWSMN